MFKNAQNDYIDTRNTLEQILINREVEDVKSYLTLTEDSLHSYELLDNINEAVECMSEHISKQNHIHIIVDSDVDGYCSAAMIYSYITKDLGYSNVSYSLHTRKQHGISDDIIIPENTNLLIVPDAGSNDFEKHRELKSKGIDIIVLDHHHVDVVSEDAIIVNNQTCNYPNKDLCGTGIVYKFLQAYDDANWTEYADKYLDLVAWANISDSMDMRSTETKYLAQIGLKAIKNPCLRALLDKRAYDIKGRVNMNNVAFYITPLCNAIIRVGEQNEKDLLFNALIENYMEFKYKKRGAEELVDEPIYDRVARLGTNIKAKQAREIEKALSVVEERIKENNLHKNNVIVIDATEFKQTLTGIMAIKIANKYGKPCLMLRDDKFDESKCGGSGRNIDFSNISSLRDYLNNLGLLKAEGHDNAFGIMDLKKSDIPKLIEFFNNDKSLKEKMFWVDFIIPFEELTDEFVMTIDRLKDHWGQGVKEPLIMIKDIEIEKEEISVIGKAQNTVKIVVDGIEFIKFRCDDEDSIMNVNEDKIKMNIIGKCSSNEWQGRVTPQIIIEGYEIIN